MKKFLSNIFVFIGLIVLYKLILISIVVYKSSGVTNMDFLGKVSGKPRIILVGSSNVEHNYDFAYLNAYFREFDVVGSVMCEPGGFYANIDKLKKLNPASQDIIVFCFPHSIYEIDKYLPLKNKRVGFNVKMLTRSALDFPDRSLQAFAALSVPDVFQLLNKKNGSAKPGPDRITFTEIPRVQSDKKYMNCWVNGEDKFFVKSISFDKGYLEEINSYLNRSFKAKIYFRFPSIRKDEYEINHERIQFLTKNYPFINSFSASVYEQEYWFNQWYHMNACGRDLNTKKFISELEPLIGAKDNSE